MSRQKKKLTREQKAAKEERRKKFMTVLMSGEQVRVRRPETIDGMDAHEFMRANADPIWLHQNEMWEYMETCDDESSDVETDDKK